MQIIQLLSEMKKTSHYHVFRYPYIIVEDLHEVHQPFHKEYAPSSSSSKGTKTALSSTTTPVLYWNVPPGHCPFLPPPPSQSKSTLQRKDRKAQKIQASKMPKPGYCECCFRKYSDLDDHVRSSFHKSFAADEGNFQKLDQMLSTLKRDQIEYGNPLVSPSCQSPLTPAKRSSKSSCKAKRKLFSLHEENGDEEHGDEHCPSPSSRKYQNRLIEESLSVCEKSFSPHDQDSLLYSDNLVSVMSPSSVSDPDASGFFSFIKADSVKEQLENVSLQHLNEIIGDPDIFIDSLCAE